MRKSRCSGLILIILPVLLCSCEEPDSYSGIPREEKAVIESWSGILARHWLLPDTTSGVPERDGLVGLQELMDICDSHPEAWAYLYSCIADTIAVLEPPEASCQL